MLKPLTVTPCMYAFYGISGFIPEQGARSIESIWNTAHPRTHLIHGGKIRQSKLSIAIFRFRPISPRSLSPVNVIPEQSQHSSSSPSFPTGLRVVLLRFLDILEFAHTRRQSRATSKAFETLSSIIFVQERMLLRKRNAAANLCWAKNRKGDGGISCCVS